MENTTTETTQETKQLRTIQEVNKDYSDLCMRVGDMEYKKRCFEAELPQLYLQINRLDAEAGEIKKSNVVPMEAKKD